MALSEEEQRLLAQLEASLAAEDPKLADALRGTSTRKIHRRRATLAGLVFILGIVALVAGMQVSPFLSVGGFVLMVVAAVTGISSWQHVNDADPSERPSPGQPPQPASADSVKQFMDKMEERWRRRQGDGL